MKTRNARKKPTSEYRLPTKEDDGDRLSWLYKKRQWKNLRGIGMAEWGFTDADGKHRETRYFITSLARLDEFAMAVREHWGQRTTCIEHWTWGSGRARRS